jgi:hypothetical protein
MGNRWGKGKGEWGAKEGEGQYTASQGSEWTGIAPRQRRDFQVSKRGSRNRGGISKQRGVVKRIGSCTSDIILILNISCQLCICRAIKDCD